MKKINLLISLLLLLPYYAFSSDSESNWEIIPVADEINIIDDNGNPKTIHPACAFDTITIQGTDTDIDNSFHFYFKQGKNDKLVVYFNGGGACWDDATCVTSLAKGDRPTYNPTVHQANSPIDAGGIFDDGNELNPFSDWNKVFIPYCTGDIHVGSSEVTYIDIDGSVTGYLEAPIIVKHHGFDNFLAVREWLKDSFSTEENSKINKLEKLLVTGSSAGGYGSTFNFPYLQDAFPKVKAVLFADASEAIVSQGFINDVFSPGGKWNVENTLPTIFSEELGAFPEEGFTAEEFNAEIFTKLTAAYPDSLFAQYTSAYDAVQVQFLKIMTMIDGGSTDPEYWGFTYDENGTLSTEDQKLFGFWNWQMELSLDVIAENTDNYQYYIGRMGYGTIHTILTDAFATENFPQPFYNEDTAEGVLFTDWIDSFVNDKKFNEENLKYSN